MMLCSSSIQIRKIQKTKTCHDPKKIENSFVRQLLEVLLVCYIGILIKLKYSLVLFQSFLCMRIFQKITPDGDSFISEVYADPSYRSYEALRFVSGITTTFTPGVIQIRLTLIKCNISSFSMYSNSGLVHLFLSTSNLGGSENNTGIHGRL